MITNSSVFKQAYDAVALFAVLNLVGLGALGAYLIGSSVVNGEKLRRIVAVLRGEDPSPGDVEVSEKRETAADEATTPATGADAIAESQMDLEIMRRESDRIKAELDQRLALNNSILLRVMTEREDFQRDREEASQEQDAAARQRREEGFEKQIAIYESLAPKIAVQHLLAMSEPDESARVLLEMNTRKAKAIVEAAKRGDQMEKMKVILQRVREVAPERSEELESKQP